MTRSAASPPRAARWSPLLWAGLTVAVAAAATGLDAPPLGSLVSVRLGASVTRAGMDLAGVVCVGLALVAVLLPSRRTVPGAALRTLEQTRTGIDRALVVTAGVWVGLVLLGIGFRSAEAFGRSVSALRAGELLAWSTRLAAGRGLVLSAGCAAVVLACAVVRLRDPTRRQSRLPLVVALFGVLTPAVTGHAGSAPDHQLSVITVALHAGAAALWVGGLGAVLVLLARHRALLDPVLPRFSQLAGVCLVTIAITGVANALLRTSSWAALLTTPYGWLILAKTGCLLLLAALGGLTRQRLRADRRPVLRWAALEVALMAVTLGLAAALTQTAG